MRRALLVLPLAVLLVGVFSSASLRADPVAVGDTINIQDRLGSPGGEFGIALSSDPDQTTLFISFCLEYNEPIDFVSTYYIAGISNSSDDGGGAGIADPLSDETAWLYWAFRSGILESMYGYNGGTTYANALQRAIWAFEEDRPVPTSGLAKFFYDLAIAQVEAGWTNDGRVGVLNLLLGGPDGRHAQDQLVLLEPQPVPEPATWLLLGGALAVLSLGLKKRAAKVTS